MKEFTIRSYTQDKYKDDMQKLLTDNGLKKSINIYLDKINEELIGTGYTTHRTVQEYLCDILFLLELNENKSSKQQSCEDCIYNVIDKLPKNYDYDCETDKFYCYKNRYTGDEIHIKKPIQNK